MTASAMGWRRSGAVAVARDFVLRLGMGLVEHWRANKIDETNISCAVNIGTFEVLVIQLLDGRFHVCSSLELNKAKNISEVCSLKKSSGSPSAIPITTNFRINYVEPGTTSKVFEIL